MPVGRICPEPSERGRICTDDRCLARAGRSRKCLSPARAARVKREQAADPIRKLRSSKRYQQWRREVKARDAYTCVECGATDDVDAHHVKSIEERPDLAFALDNGETLCRGGCHNAKDAARRRDATA